MLILGGGGCGCNCVEFGSVIGGIGDNSDPGEGKVGDKVDNQDV